MPARRCEDCGWLVPLGTWSCPRCEGRTDYVADASPEDNVEPPRVGAQRGDAEAWRREQFERMGFTLGQSLTLANTRGDDGFFLDWQRVERLLQRARASRSADDARDVVFMSLA